MALTRLRQLAAREEAVSGTAIALTAAYGKLLVEDPKMSHETEMFPRNPVLATFTKLGRLAGKRPATLGFNILMQGSGAKATPPEWSKLIKSMGFSENLMEQITIGAITSGPLLHGEGITGTSSSATGTVVKNTVDDTTTLYFVTLTGTFETGEVVTGAVSGATATTSSVPSDAGTVWLPANVDINTLTLGSYEDGVKKLIKGARGKGKLNFKTGEPCIINAEFMGVNAGVTDVDLLAIDYGTLPVPPVLLQAAFTSGDDSLRISELEIGFESTLAPVDDISDAAGLHSYRITDRQFVFSYDPESELVANRDFYGNWIANTESSLSMTLGVNTGNKFEFYAPKSQIDKIEDDSREGIQINRITGVLNGNENIQNDEFCFIQL